MYFSYGYYNILNNGVKKYFPLKYSTGLKITPYYWKDKPEYKARETKEFAHEIFNRKLENLRNLVINIHQELENKGKIVTPNLLREELNKAQGKGPNIYRMNLTEFKAKVAIEAIKEIKTISELAQLYQVHPNLIGHWKKEFLANAGKVFNAAKSESDEVKKLKQKNEDLIHQIGQLSVDINWLKKKVL
jgi:transposase-like protein